MIAKILFIVMYVFVLLMNPVSNKRKPIVVETPLNGEYQLSELKKPGKVIMDRTTQFSNRIIDQLLPYNDNLEKRETDSIRLIVIHCTELPTLEMARQYGERILYEGSRTGNSGHYYIDRNGGIYRYVNDNRIAHHTIGYNHVSIGIEIVNLGRYPNWFNSKSQVPSEKYTDEQIQAVIGLLTYLKQNYPTIVDLNGHSDLDLSEIQAEDNPSCMIRRKIDPGPLFPWDIVRFKWNELQRNL